MIIVWTWLEKKYYNTTANEVWGILVLPCPSVCPSVGPSVWMSVPVCRHDYVQACSEKWVHRFLWKSVYWLLTIWRCAPGICILIGQLFFILQVFFLGGGVITRNSCSVLKLMKNFDYNDLQLYYSLKGCQIHFTGLRWYYVFIHLSQSYASIILIY